MFTEQITRVTSLKAVHCMRVFTLSPVEAARFAELQCSNVPCMRTSALGRRVARPHSTCLDKAGPKRCRDDQ
ncbi:hypothetical protein E2C01_026759 [Portunus trituberculatus]|uniref:Uncharacterized protein n=1 Tax=Portunus trituberculatus TaxID=210409 RepID=A0A5B7EG61_PORTR|nr:hypothetical protein [Portunus trituberculatus]